MTIYLLISIYIQYKQFIKKSRDTVQKYHFYHAKQYQAFHRTIKCNLLNCGVVQYGYHQDFNI